MTELSMLAKLRPDRSKNGRSMGTKCMPSIAWSAYSYVVRLKPHEGSLTVTDAGADFTDTWHQPTNMPCLRAGRGRALLEVSGTYGAGAGPDWGWTTKIALRPSGELVIQMTNITPWGETGL